MTYPMDGLAVIAPILFMVMIIGFPLIGLAVGWKRALYWGGGNFLFYVIGLIVWKCAGGAIGTSIGELLKQMIPSLKELDPTKLATSVAAPVFFLIVLLIGNLLLLINYYAWFKKVAKIKFDIAARKAIKKAKLEYKAKGKEIPKHFTAKVTFKKDEEVVKVQEKPYSARVGNRLIGTAAMGLLMVPVVASLTNAVYFTTTNTTTRSKHAFSQALYESLNNTDNNVSWFSYYGGTSGEDFDALLTALSLTDDSSKVDVEYYDYETGQTTHEDSTVVELVTQKIPDSVSGVSNNLGNITESKITEIFTSTTGGETAQIEAVNKQLQSYAAPLNRLADQWNALVSKYPTETSVLLGSSNLMDLVKQLLNHQNEEIEKFTITKTILDDIFGEDRQSGSYFTIKKDYLDAKELKATNFKVDIKVTINSKEYTFNFTMNTINELAVKVSTINNIKEVAYSFIEFDSTVTQDDKTFFDERVDELIALILEAK